MLPDRLPRTSLVVMTSWVALLSPALAADRTVDLAHRVEQLEAELRAVRQELNAVRTSDEETKAAVTKDRIAAEAAAKQATTAADAGKAKPDQPKVTQSATGLFAVSSADGKNTLAVTGRLHFDAGAYVGFKADNPVVGVGNTATGTLSNGVNVRRGRIGVTGKALGDFTYSFIYDGGNSQDATAKGIESAIVGYTGFKNTIVEIGYTDTLFTLDEATGSNNIMFLERPSPQVIAATFGGGDNRSEFGARTWGDRWWLGAYITGPAIGVSHTLTGEQFAAYQRATYQVVQDKSKSLHIGVAALELLQVPDSGPGTARNLSLSDQPELRIDPTTFLNTGAIGTVANPVTGGAVYNAELAASLGGLYLQSEYFRYDLKRSGRSNANFDGAYAELSYTLGGHRNYVANTGAHSGVIPDRNVSLADGAWGAWEIAARISHVNLTDQFTPGVAIAQQPFAVNGGRQTNVALGANWYLSPNMRWMVNYIHSRYRKENSTAVVGAVAGAPVGATIDALAARWQVAF